MKKVLLFSALALGFLMSSCSGVEDVDPVVGTWVMPETDYTNEAGFVFEKNGTMSLIGFEANYKYWERTDSLLVMKDEFIADTFMIEKLTDVDLSLSQQGVSIELKKKNIIE